jgi:hypothetical protein
MVTAIACHIGSSASGGSGTKGINGGVLVDFRR